MAFSGRSQFKKYKFILSVFSSIISIFPKYLQNLIWDFSSPFEGRLSCALRYCILKSLSAYCGDNVFIGRRVVLKNPSSLRVGNNVSIHSDCYIDSAGEVSIGDNVSIAHNSSIISFEHSWAFTNLPIKYNPTEYKRVEILSDVWIGCGVRVLSGSRVRSRVIIAAGSVVKGLVEENSIYAGIPCKKIKDL